MAHFAELDSNNVVLRVIVVHDSVSSANGVESEQAGADFCHNTFGGTWKQTSFNSNLRKRFAGVGYTYDPNLDAFIPPKPYPSWVFNDVTLDWKAPVDKPNGDGVYLWNEETTSWQEVEVAE